MEQIKTFILMTFLALIFMFFGGLIGGEQGVIIAFIVALGMNFFSYFFSDKLVLKHYHAVKVDENSAGGLYAIVRRLANAANVPMPSVYIIPEQIPNAFATGRNPNNAAVAVTEGLLNLLSENEIKGVLAHEMSHVRHYDILIGSVAAVFAGAIAILANFAKFGAVFGGNENNRQNGILMIVAAIIMPIAAAIIQMAISRSREYKADAGAANLTKHPEWLISALSKLENYAQNRTMQNATPQSAHMFIINPFSGVKSSLSQLFRTHPSTKDRIARLNEIKQSM